jgi:hypothetical protein
LRGTSIAYRDRRADITPETKAVLLLWWAASKT